MFLVLACSCLCAKNWSQVLSGEWRCSWSSADRQCSNYIWVTNNSIAYWSALYITDLTVYLQCVSNGEIAAIDLTHCGLVMPYGVIELDQHGFRQCTKLFFFFFYYLDQYWLMISLVKIHLRAISQEIFKISILNISLKITNLWLQQSHPGTNDVTYWSVGEVTLILGI